MNVMGKLNTLLYYQILLKYFSLFFQIIEHNNCPTQKDYQRSIIGDKSKMSEDLKWIFNSNYPNDPFASKCSEKMGDVYTQFEGYGVGKLTYGGCSKGRVEVYLDGELISHIKKDTPSKVVEFNFAPYSKLEIKEVDEEAVIEIISLEVGCKGIKIYKPYAMQGLRLRMKLANCMRHNAISEFSRS